MTKLDENIEEIKRRYANGESLNSIAHTFASYHGPVANALKKAGVALRPRYIRRRSPLYKLTVHPTAGLRPESLSYFKGKISGLRDAGKFNEADWLERDVAKIQELGIYFGYPLQCVDAAFAPQSDGAGQPPR